MYGDVGEQHASLDAALGVWEAARAAADPLYTRREAWPVLRGVAEWVGARGTWTTRGFEVLQVMGPDGSVGKVNNSNYVNLASMMVLEAALSCHAMLPPGEQDPAAAAAWREILEAFLPLDDTGRNIVLHSTVPTPTRDPQPSATWSVGNLPFLMAHGLPSRSRPQCSTHV